MKHTPIFRSLLMALLVLAVSTVQMSCSGSKGDKGDPGPAGATGPAGSAGAAGVAGAAGAAGNANVTQVTFDADFAPSASGRTLNLPAAVTTDMINKSVILVYLKVTPNSSPLWYQIPGLILSTDDFRYFVNADARTLTIIRAIGTGVTMVTDTRVLVIPASTVINGRQAAVDYSDYEAVKRFYNLAD